MGTVKVQERTLTSVQDPVPMEIDSLTIRGKTFGTGKRDKVSKTAISNNKGEDKPDEPDKHKTHQ